MTGEMRQLSRRALVISMGVGVVLSEMKRSIEPAKSAYLVESFEEIKECLDKGGKVLKDAYVGQEKGIKCIEAPDAAKKPDLDQNCREKLKSETGAYDPAIDQCVDRDDDGCFLTTCCVKHIGASDQCYELRTLRGFRDGPLLQMSGGPEAIANYYRTAPAIVSALNGSRQRDREISRIYVRYVLPSAIAATLGFNRLAFGFYRSMMADLMHRFRQEIEIRLPVDFNHHPLRRRARC